MPRLLILLLAACLVLSGCSAYNPLAPMVSDSSEVGAAIPAPRPDVDISTREAATLWFRFGTEPYLAPESREIELSPTEPYELSLLRALISGPSASAAELSGLYPPGTQVISTYRQDRLLFVTLSRQIMNNYADETDNWAAQPDRAEEARLRRTLAMQAIAATVTENCPVDKIVILVEQGSQVTDSMRLRQQYYRTTSDDAALAEPLIRDEALLLTQQTTLDVILRTWSERDWLQLYRYIARRDSETGQERPEYEAFAALMDDLPHLTDYAFAGGHVTQDGIQATFTLDATLMLDGNEAALEDSIIHLTRERGLWRIGVSQLTCRKEAAP
ncbi:MAG: GerMN domain-containing protein [Clostridia bacterium]|nr:GerMN domain-containing protein [Clostridia bacterium]